MRAAIYIRVSTDEQAKEGYSIPAQKERLKQFVRSQDWSIYDYYLEEGFSAKDMNRPELRRMMEAVRSGKVDVVLVYRLDRLTRSVVDLYQLLDEFERYNVKFKSATEVYDTTSAIGRLFLTLVAALAQWERENLAERVRFGMEQMVYQKQRPGAPPPFGYNLENQMLVINREEETVVRHIFDRYINGAGMNKIAIECNRLGYRSKKGAGFTRATIHSILKNPCYYGALRWNYRDAANGKVNEPEQWIVIENVYPAIVDKETFELARQAMERRSGKHPRQLASVYIFSGLLRCNRCGGAMTGHTMTKKESEYRLQRYICSNARLKTCDAPSLTDRLVEEAFVGELARIIHMYSDIAKAVRKKGKRENPGEHPSPARELEKIQKKRMRFQLAFAEGLLSLKNCGNGWLN
ncbi:recombinase family protein [Aneurinibacillus tyrosinisolvens]|uniref:recombinase family protein n=1 Tax=Aneurinibacillus tyrosinisolvens TaxID=1443435 RepID=UPI00069BE9BF|nr:recombinase family protein [Aneurinibacillus tyrosinisolvens]